MVGDQTIVDLYAKIGELTGAIGALKDLVTGNHVETQRALGALQDDHVAVRERFARVETAVKAIEAIVERIRKPVDTMISLRNLLIGAGMLASAIGALAYGVPHDIGLWLYHRFSSSP